MIKQVRLKIYGRVQMVLFRDTSRRKAKNFGLTGWVKNASDKTVEILAQGSVKELKKFIDWCYTGPGLARVDKIDIAWQEVKKKRHDFKIIYRSLIDRL